MLITGVFIGGVSPSKCKYYSEPLQQSYTRNILGLTRNFPVTTASGLQLRRTPLFRATLFAMISLDTPSKDFLFFARRLKHLAGAPVLLLRCNIRRPSCSSLDLRFSSHIIWSSRILWRAGRRWCPQHHRRIWMPAGRAWTPSGPPREAATTPWRLAAAGPPLRVPWRLAAGLRLHGRRPPAAAS